MKAKITYAELDMLNQSIKRESQKPAFAVLLGEKIKNFYARNSIRLNAMEDKFEELIAKYVKHEKEVPVTKKDENDILVYEFNDEESREKYMQEIKDFCARQIEVQI